MMRTKKKQLRQMDDATIDQRKQESGDDAEENEENISMNIDQYSCSDDDDDTIIRFQNEQKRKTSSSIGLGSQLAIKKRKSTTP